MQSPVFYIIVAMMLASATLATVFFLIWRTQGEKPYALTWSVGFLAAFGQWSFYLMRDFFPDQPTWWLTVNALALVLITLGLRGHCQRTHCQTLPNNLWPYAVAFYAVIFWTTVVQQHVGMSMAVAPAVAALALFLSAVMIIRHREESRVAERAAAISFVIFGVMQGIAAGMALLQGATGSETYLSLYIHYNFLTLPSGYIATAIFVILMLASDLSQDMKEIAIRDQLTNVLNRRGLAEQGAAAYATARRNDLPVSVVMTDIDRFKNINDKFGHAAGDDALVHFSDILKAGRRAEDILARVGGEEFALILPGTGVDAAMKLADELRALVDSTPCDACGEEVAMTASFGVSTLSVKDTCLSDTVQRADRALYRSKRAGRNQVDLESSQIMLTADGKLKSLNA